VSEARELPEASTSGAGRTPLRDIALLFLQLGTTAFGGPAAHIAMMEEAMVRRRRWLSREEFLDLLGATNLLPGPNSTEMAIHIGFRRGGWPGLLVAGICFILPAALIVLVLAWAYVRWSALPEASAILYGMKPVVIAIVLLALGTLAHTALKSAWLASLGLASIVAFAFGAHELVVLLVAGVIAAVVISRPRSTTQTLAFLAAAPAAAATGAAASFSLGALFLAFLKVGAVLFGSGYVLLALLRADLVERRQWLTEGQLLDAVVVGQLTPGPVFTTATFVGYLLGRMPGAVVATVGIFLPAFIFVAVSGPLIPRLRRSRTAGAFLDGVIVASLGLMAVVTWQLGRAAIVDFPTLAIALVSLGILARFRLGSAWLLAAGALIGWLLHSLT
jgi:chromate transporter